jgi:hypothetical protein
VGKFFISIVSKFEPLKSSQLVIYPEHPAFSGWSQTDSLEFQWRPAGHSKGSVDEKNVNTGTRSRKLGLTSDSTVAHEESGARHVSKEKESWFGSVNSWASRVWSSLTPVISSTDRGDEDSKNQVLEHLADYMRLSKLNVKFSQTWDTFIGKILPKICFDAIGRVVYKFKVSIIFCISMLNLNFWNATKASRR